MFTIGMADSLMVANVGESAVSAVSLVDSVMVLIITIMTALSTGGAVVVGQFLGQKKETEARTTGDQLLLFVLTLSVAIVAIMYIFRKLIMSWVFGEIEDDVAYYCNVYYLIVMASIPFMSVYNVGAALFRSIGNSRISMMVAVLMNVINVVGNAVLIYGLERGVEGVAIPTLAARMVAAVIMYVLLKNPKLKIHTSKSFVYRPDWKLICKILRIGIPNGIENSMFQLGKLILLSMISGFGTASIAANAVGNIFSMVAILPGMAMGYGIVAVISHCVGMGDYTQVRYYTKKLLKWTYAVMFISNTLIILVVPLIIDLYELTVEAGELATKIIIFHCIFAIFVWPLSFALPNTLRSAGDVTYTMVISVGSMWIFRILCGIYLARFCGLEVFGVWIAMVVDWLVRAICFSIRYKRGKWRHTPLK